jgi:hypothetical protein
VQHGRVGKQKGHERVAAEAQRQQQQRRRNPRLLVAAAQRHDEHAGGDEQGAPSKEARSERRPRALQTPAAQLKGQ